jgi:hypothetical protein
MIEKKQHEHTLKGLATLFTILLLCWIVYRCTTSPPSPTSTESAVPTIGEDAERVCKAMQGALTTSCEVHAWGKTIDVRMDTTGVEARKICLGTVKVLSGYTEAFKGEWRLRMFSPYSGDQPIAVCAL